MDCRTIRELIDAIAAGDAAPDAATRAHLESCTRCASDLATARRIEAVMAGIEVPAAPARFTQDVVQRIRRERWRSEQYVDRFFNLAIVAAVLVIIGGVVAVFNVQELLTLTAAAWQVLQEDSRRAASDAGPSVFTYASAIVLLVSALAMWWWAERRWQF